MPSHNSLYCHRKSNYQPKLSGCNNLQTVLVLIVINSFILVYYGIESYVIQLNTTSINLPAASNINSQNRRGSVLFESKPYNSFDNNNNHQHQLKKTSSPAGYVEHNSNPNVDSILKNSSQKYSNSYLGNLNNNDNLDVISEGSGNGPPLSNQKQRHKPKFDDTEGDDDDDDEEDDEGDYDYKDNVDSGSGQGNGYYSNPHKDIQSVVTNFSKPYQNINSQNLSSSANYSSTDQKFQAYLPFRPPPPQHHHNQQEEQKQQQQPVTTTAVPLLNNNNVTTNPVSPPIVYTSPKPITTTSTTTVSIVVEDFNTKNFTTTNTIKPYLNNLNQTSTTNISNSDTSSGTFSFSKQNVTKVTDKDYDYNYEDESENNDDESEESINFEDDESTDDNSSMNKNSTSTYTSPTTMTPTTVTFKLVTTPPYNKQTTQKPVTTTSEPTTIHPMTTTISIIQSKPAIWQPSQNGQYSPTSTINSTKNITNFAQSNTPSMNNFLTTTTVSPIGKHSSTQLNFGQGDRVEEDEDSKDLEDEEEDEDDEDDTIEEDLNEDERAKFLPDSKQNVGINNHNNMQSTNVSPHAPSRENQHHHHPPKQNNNNNNNLLVENSMQSKVIDSTTKTTTFSPTFNWNSEERIITNRPLVTTGSPIRIPPTTPSTINILPTTTRSIPAITTSQASTTTTTTTITSILFPTTQRPVYFIPSSTFSPPRVSLLPDVRYYHTTPFPRSVNTYTINPTNIPAYDKNVPQDDDTIIKQIYDKSVQVYQATNKAFEAAVEALNALAFESKINHKTFEPLFTDSLKFMLGLGLCVFVFVLTMVFLVYLINNLIDKKTQPQEPDNISIY